MSPLHSSIHARRVAPGHLPTPARAPHQAVRRLAAVLTLLLGLTALATACGPTPARVDEADPTEPEPVSHTLVDEQALLFVEHPALVVGEPADFLAHLTLRVSGAPLTAGRVSVSLSEQTVTQEGPRRAGLFVPRLVPERAGSFRGLLVVSADSLETRFDLGELTVHADRAAALAAAPAATAAPAAPVPFLMEQQWVVGLLLAQAGPRHMTRTLDVPARLVLAEDAQAEVCAPLAGRLLAADERSLPHSGERVQAGQVLALVEPPLAPGDAAQLRALAAEWDLAALQVARDLADAEARLSFSTGELARLDELLPQGLATRRELAAAERDRDLALADRDAARTSRQALDDLRSDGPGSSVLRLPLVAPIDAVVAHRDAVLGASVQPGQCLLRLVDPTRLWLEARLVESELGLLDGAAEAIARLPALADRTLRLDGTSDGRLHSIGPELEGPSRSVLLRYELLDPAPDLRAGLLAEVALSVRGEDVPVAVPRDAIVVTQGQPTLYVLLEGELFQRRDVSLGLTDDTHVQVLAGLSAGEHVASRAASSLRMAELSPDDAGHGHAH